MAKKTPRFKLIVAETQIIDDVTPKDRGGGEPHGLFKNTVIKTIEKTIDPQIMKQSFENCLEQTKQLLENAAKKISEGWEIESINLSFAVNGEGSIGLATVGVEAGIEITLIPKGNTN